MRNKKSILVYLLLIFSILLNPTSALANKKNPAEDYILQPKISPWAVKGINESQMVGLVTIDSEVNKRDFQKEVSLEDINKLNKNFKKKLDSHKIRSYKGSNLEVPENNTREAIVINLFNLITQYDNTIKEGTDPVKYLVEQGILKGKGNDYKLKDKSSLEEAIILYTRTLINIFNSKDLGSKGIFYKVEHKGNTAYLFGSIHIGDYSMYPLDEEIIKAFHESDELYVEVNTSDLETLEEIQSYQYRLDKTSLKDDLGEDLYSRLKKIMHDLEIEEDLYITMKPWAVLNLLSTIPIQMENPYTSILGIDNYFITMAYLENKPILPLETVETQMKVLEAYYSKNEEDIVAYIEEALKSIEAGEEKKDVLESMDKMKSVWIRGDEKEMSKIFKSNDSAHILVETRDPEMAKSIKNLLEAEGEKTYFIMVGAGHYAPEDSIRKILTDYGFTVKKLNH